MALKHYSFNNKYDHIYYFNYLIEEVLNYKDQFNICLNELTKLNNNPNVDKIEVLQFEGFSRRKDGILRFLCNLLGDETKGALSFRKYRKKLKKDAPKYGFTLPELPKPISTQLNSLNQLRNWSLHYPETLVMASKGLLKCEIRDNLILRSNYKFYEKEYLTKMVEELSTLNKSFEEIFNQMIKDYELLIGKKVLIAKNPMTLKTYDLMNPVATSWEMQIN